MTPLEKKKLELSLSKCRTAMEQIEYQIMEKEEAIERDKRHMELQKKREKELLEQLKEE